MYMMHDTQITCSDDEFPKVAIAMILGREYRYRTEFLASKGTPEDQQQVIQPLVANGHALNPFKISIREGVPRKKSRIFGTDMADLSVIML